MSDGPMFMDRKTAAKTAGVSIDTIGVALRTGALKAKRTAEDEKGQPAGKYLISREALQDWFDGLVDA